MLGHQLQNSVSDGLVLESVSNYIIGMSLSEQLKSWELLELYWFNICYRTVSVSVTLCRQLHCRNIS